MFLSDLNKKELDIVLDLYIDKRKDFKGLFSFEEFIENHIERCKFCNNIFYSKELCENCDYSKEYDYDFEYFDRNKEHYLYGLD